MSKAVYIQLGVASVIRLALMISSHRQTIANRVEVSTLLNSWKRVTEGVSLYQHGISPYAGDVFHETPIALWTFNVIISYFPSLIGIIFILCDMMTGVILYMTARLYMKEMETKQNEEKASYAEGVSELLLSENDFNLTPTYVLSAYLFNPYNIVNCVGYTTTTFGNLCLSCLFLSMIKGYRIPSCMALALTVYQSFYTVVLIAPVCIYLARRDRSTTVSVLLTLTTFISTLSIIFCISYLIVGDWAFLNSVYVVILTVPDLRPNIGLFWYFFTEMFEHFRLLFIFSFQLNATLLYLAPLSLRFHSNPMLLATSLTALIAVFKSYPCLGDVGFYLSLLPMWKHLYNSKAVVPDMQQSFIILCSLVITSVLGPTVWHLWIYSRSANANFYFGVTLAFATAQIFLITDVLFAYIKREFTLIKGIINVEDKNKMKLLLE
uniref:Putative major facilitator superfamily permease n=1 Tax=Panstrongylus lignarius TaxID=156445 RepID=A0A224XGS1_9HEMI